ncbi:ABC transporter ATP-binding protein [Fructobacillus sp. M1-13]|uniref:ABC transporter ATP-binding protein n=1 Tax=Fructobacillus papyriferae TaxID=2713171 RepID=A0ABS5QNS6_9LACO|nr:ABC transporter ATP-binding protein [Fructobacillus papyriferae]MBS9334788.1 ABC transporter ATP-binding protein [Fructobacillus papyriferae]MCD2158778.1 ABC transporter ATP-binding protein [Fructobacillus papyriferae]
MGLHIDNLTAGYAGQTVVSDLTFAVPAGRIVALIGLNGAGKSTTLKQVIGLKRPLAGSLTLDEFSLEENPAAYKNELAYIPEQPVLYDELTLDEHLHLVLAAHKQDDAAHWARVEELLALFRLTGKGHWLPVHFSKGMRQKVMLVSAFALDTKLLVIDEPFLGLDVLAQKQLIDLMKERAAAGTAVLLTTHLLSQASAYVDDFALLEEGRLSFFGSAEALASSHHLSESDLDALFS